MPSLLPPLLKLTVFYQTDAEALHRVIASSPEITKWTEIPYPYTLDDAREFLGRVAVDRPASKAANGRITYTWAIRDAASDEVIGCISVYPLAHDSDLQSNDPEIQAQLFNVTPNGEPMLSYYIGQAFSGKGIATAAIKAVTDRVMYGIVDNRVFDSSRDHVGPAEKMPRLHAEYYDGNVGSERVLLRNGFVIQDQHSMLIWRVTGKPHRIPWLVKTAE